MHLPFTVSYSGMMSCRGPWQPSLARQQLQGPFPIADPSLNQSAGSPKLDLPHTVCNSKQDANHSLKLSGTDLCSTNRGSISDNGKLHVRLLDST